MKNKFITLAVAVVMLTIAMAVTAFAATEPHWEVRGENQENWFFIGKDGEPVTEKFQKSGENWYWLNEDGIMAKSALVDYNDNKYYVDENGAMVTNAWVLINNEDIDNRWMYFASTGKANKDGWKKVGENKFFFEDYLMNYGFLDADGKMIDKDSDDAWKEAVYYCGSNESGAQKTGWVEVDSMDADNGKAWIYFGVNGKKVADCKKVINGATYIFNADGSMKTAFVDATVSSASVSAYMDENGKMLKKGWVYAFINDNAEEQKWYYADNKGELVKGVVKSINGKKYAFNADGEMLTGFVQVNTDDMTVASDAYAAENVTFDVATSDLGTKTFMYFAENEDPMKQGPAATGKTVVPVNEANLTINFSSRGIAEGTDGKFVVKKNYAYINSVLYAREDMDYKYEVIMDENGDFYVLTVKSGKASKKGTFTDNDNNVRYIIKDGVVTIEHKNANGKWE